jgi:hypothetical protein
MFLNPTNVREMIKQAEREDEVIVVRCIRKGKASKVGGPDAGDLFELHCAQKPKDFVSSGARDRAAEDEANGVLTVYASNRRNETGQLGGWRRVNIAQVQKVIYKGVEHEVVTK